MKERYRISPDVEGHWCVMDVVTCLPASFKGRRLIKLKQEVASEAASLMNRMQLQHELAIRSRPQVSE